MTGVVPSESSALAAMADRAVRITVSSPTRPREVLHPSTNACLAERCAELLYILLDQAVLALLRTSSLAFTEIANMVYPKEDIVGTLGTSTK